jgi:hypothetical protein
MIAICQGDDSQLIVGCTRIGVDDTCEVVVSNRRSPIATLSSDELCFTIAGEVTQTNEGGMAREEYALAEISVRIDRRLE